MTDTHTHLLWGVDDGSPSADHTQRLLCEIDALGINKAFCTPHIMVTYPQNDSIVLREHFHEKFVVNSPQTNIKLRLVGEYMLDQGFLAKLNASQPPLTYDGRHILIEMSHIFPSPNLSQTIFDIQNKGYIPVLAHPERYGTYLKRTDFDKLKHIGCEFQMNMLSLGGEYGSGVSNVCMELLSADMYQYIGSDIHNTNFLRAIKDIKLSSDIYDRLEKLTKNNDTLWV